jgi:hypothetical protein
MDFQAQQLNGDWSIRLWQVPERGSDGKYRHVMRKVLGVTREGSEFSYFQPVFTLSPY